jgi:hypothetical protein
VSVVDARGSLEDVRSDINPVSERHCHRFWTLRYKKVASLSFSFVDGLTKTEGCWNFATFKSRFLPPPI